MRGRTLTYLLCSVALAVLLYTTRGVSSPTLSLSVYVGTYTVFLCVCLWASRTVREPLLRTPLRIDRRTLSTGVVALPLCLGTVLVLSAVGEWIAPSASAALPLTPYNVVRYAILCPIVEELYFRLLPMRLFEGEHARLALLLSALTFTLFHPTPSRILYALAAGALFFLIDLYAASIVPSLIAHLAINLLSLVYATYGATPAFAWSFYIVCGVLFVASALCLVRKKKDILAHFREIFT